MSNEQSIPQDEDSVPGANGAPQTNAQAGSDLDAQVTDDVGGVQGTAPDEDQVDAAPATTSTGSPSDEPAPDAGEIEWAGQVVKKPPTPQ
jgi:hypothetical protein